MPKVKELIKNAIFTKAAQFDTYSPEVTIILPTYKRGDNGLFKLCVDSILGQTFKNFELIIVDDASYDSTASQIEEFIRKDHRVVCIRHEKNIGLPAVSEAEAYLKSRGQKIFFVFDDNEYKPEALEVSYRYQQKNQDALICYSTVESMNFDGSIVYLGKVDFNYNILMAYNYIPNGGVMIDKRVLDDIGLYDPHICITRLCDWDLWRRIGKKYKFHRIDLLVGKEKGVMQDDALGNTHYLDRQLISEWMSVDRDEALKPENILDYDINNIPEHLSFLSKLKIAALLKNKFSKFYDQNYCKINDDEKAGYILLCNEFTSSIELCFSNIANKVEIKFVINNIERYFRYSLDLFLNARAIIFLREIEHEYIKLAEILKLAGIPYYYYTDDNFFELYPLTFDKKNKSFIGDAKAVLLTSEALIDYYKKNELHHDLRLMSPVIKDTQIAENKVNLDHFKNTKEINIVFGSIDRFNAYIKLVDEIKQFAKKYKITLYIFSNNKIEQEYLRNSYHDINISILFLPIEFSHNAFINMLKNKKIHFFIHPKNNKYINNYGYKTLNFLINGYLTSSLVLVPDIFPYNNLKQFGYMRNLVVSEDVLWTSAMEKFLNDFDLVEKTFAETEKYCLDNFNSELNVSIINKIVSECKSVDVLEFCYRTNRANELIQMQLDVMQAINLRNILQISMIKKIIRKILKKIYNKSPQFMQKIMNVFYLKIYSR